MSLIIIEAMILSLMVDASLLPKTGISSVLLSESGNFLRWFIVSAALLVVFLVNSRTFKLHKLVTEHSIARLVLKITIQLILFLCLILLTFQVFQRQAGIENYFNYLWVLFAALTGLAWSSILASRKSWKALITTERVAIASAFALGLLIVLLGFYFQQFWGAMTEFTLGISKLSLELFYSDIVFDISESKLGINSFWVYIDPVCSGIEGAVLAISIASIYLYLTRSSLKLPQALILIPLAGAISIALNIVRIVLLIIIGEEFSPALAVGGFHSVAGWISAVLVALFIVYVFSSWTWIQKSPEIEKDIGTGNNDSNLAQAILIPFAAFMALTLLAGSITLDFNYFYPINVIITAGIIYYFWPAYKLKIPKLTLQPLLIGTVVAVLWIYLIPADEDLNQGITKAFSTMPLWALIGWGSMRILGFLLLAPLLEELIFRGYLIARLSGQEINNNDKPTFSILALIVSSIIFGILHHAWMVGIIAGLLFAYVRYHSKSISSCIIAHSVANFWVLCWAIYFGNWTLV